MAEWSKGLVSGATHFDGVGSNPTPVMLHRYKLKVLLSWKQLENNKRNSFYCIGRMAKWSKSYCCHATLFKLKGLTPRKQFKNYKQHTFDCIDYIRRMAEWSKALVSGTSHFDGLGSNPTPVMPHRYKLAVFSSKKTIPK